MSFKGWGSVLPDRFVYRSVRAFVRTLVWSAIAVVLLAVAVDAVWIAWEAMQ